MKTNLYGRSAFRAACLVPVLMSVFLSCESLGLDEEEAVSGELRISFVSDMDDGVRSAFDLPDTSDFILNVTSSDGTVVYQGAYGDSPEAMNVPPGGYLVSAVSCVFDKPAFSKPQFGDERYVEVPAGAVIDVRLMCSQMNSGVRLDIMPEFLEVYPEGILFLKSSKGKLMYGYSEKRIAYFLPGAVSLLFSNAGKDEVLMTKNIAPQQILTIKVSAEHGSGDDEKGGSALGNVSVAIDTTREWIDESFVIGQEKGDDSKDAMTVYQALDAVGREDVWVSGYVVGGDLTPSSASYDIPFTSRTNLLIGSRSSVSDRNTCIAVQLPSGDVRNSLNLVDNPWILGRKVMLRGDVVESYYGIVGLKNVSDFEIN